MSAPAADPQAATPPVPSTVDAVIVGAGFSGMYLLHKLRGMGLTAVVFEAGTDVGGTWYWNRYPGARVDVESLAYSYSFDPDLEQTFEWEERYPTQPEILRYAQHVADRFDLRRDIVFRTRVVGAHFDEDGGTWEVRTEHGDAVHAQYLVMATGCLSASKHPEIPGLETFKGASYHTAHWPHEGVDFTGLSVGVIGTGSSGVQSIPVIAAQASDVTVFQRTPAYSLPARNRKLRPDEVAEMREHYRDYRQAQKESGFGVPVPPATKSALEVSPEEREARFEEAWESGSLVNLLTTYTDLALSQEANDLAKAFVHRKIKEIVEDPQTAADLCPEYPVGTKRPCLDTHYYETYNRPNVHLVNLQREPLVEITEKGIRTAAEEYVFDAIVYATGFDAMTGSLTNVDIRGRGGASLKETWSAGPRTYLGIGSAGFPNLFMITGPGSPSVLSNMIVSIEQHVDWVCDAIAHLRDQGLRTIEASQEAQDAWVDHVNLIASYTLYPKANSWYMGANVPGKPRVFMPYAGGVGEYRKKCDEVAAKGYEGFLLDA
ncbi:flavin-containing monooxygenase [Geodermatophilus sabuli]|uniref:Cyclohexanone monooxygenase n=1 Tax=Geodermatophilus sabuli TaxID=1564158 RepID=A0A285EHG3_9ACTN|nr:NAD(P)/FAD-dependent oxidoreductase [Geodermatophilus sabuli]MBB3083910.1 cyclohexanone monooxygenase [Geodermatophilus sabuli]SNX98559.1 cyclohexanone monooxygenase [Geodermatophilus sabuli]